MENSERVSTVKRGRQKKGGNSGKKEKKRGREKGKGSVKAVSCHLSCCDLSGLTAHKSPCISQLCDIPSSFIFNSTYMGL